jgi:hypothetical protein
MDERGTDVLSLVVEIQAATKDEMIFFLERAKKNVEEGTETESFYFKLTGEEEKKNADDDGE